MMIRLPFAYFASVLTFLKERLSQSVLFVHKLLGLVRVGVFKPSVGISDLIAMKILLDRKISSHLWILIGHFD